MIHAEMHKYDVQWPGIWIVGEDRNWAFETDHILRLVQEEFIIAVASFLKYKPVTDKTERKRLSQPASQYDSCLNTIYARSFVLSLDLINKLLKTLPNPTKQARSGIERYHKTFGQLKHMRDSIAHIEDRGRGLDRNKEKLRTPVIVLGCFSEKGYDFTGADGKEYHIYITKETLLLARDSIQSVIDGYSWEGPSSKFINELGSFTGSF
jgi:hypothetical protein